VPESNCWVAVARGGRTAERDPSKLAWERAGDQPEECDGTTRGEVEFPPPRE